MEAYKLEQALADCKDIIERYNLEERAKQLDNMPLNITYFMLRAKHYIAGFRDNSGFKPAVPHFYRALKIAKENPDRYAKELKEIDLCLNIIYQDLS